MRRCLFLARLGMGKVAPNPVVGAVLVYKERIIGEGYHIQYGQAHAEVNCINNVRQEDQQYIALATLYVSLEPCAHYGKTPPCADLVIKNKIPAVVVGCQDPFKEVAGKGIQKMQEAGIQVVTGVLEKECIELNKRFFIFHELQRPYIVLKWAQTADQKVGSPDHSRVLISNEITNRLVHKWRSEEAGILVGTNTALYDDPSLTGRLWGGINPVRLVIDKNLRLPSHLQLFDGSVKTIVFNLVRQEEGKVIYHRLAGQKDFVIEMLAVLFKLNIQSVLVEGGPAVLQTFIKGGHWDEARVITNHQMHISSGVQAPQLVGHRPSGWEKILSDTIQYFVRS